MYKKIWLLVVIILSAYVLKAQEGSITGKVTDATSGNAIAYASVFLSNATKSAPTNTDGGFTLTGIQPGQYDLVVSYVGYKTYSQKVLVGQSKIEVAIKLNKQTINLQAVTVRSRKADRQADLKKFREAFIGTSDNAAKCTVLNPEVIDIDYDSDANTLDASTGQMLKIENRALGYRLNILLNSLKVNYITGAVNYNGKLFFEELKGDPDEMEKWKVARAKTYNGSIRHFYRSLYLNAVTENGFEIHHAASRPNSIKKPDELIARKLDELKTKGVNANNDSLRYWKMQQQLAPYLYTVNKSVAQSDSIVELSTTPGLYNLKFDDHIYLVSTNKQTIRSNIGNFYTWTMLKLNKNFAQFDKNGILTNDADVTYEGTHIEKIADELPYDYVPEIKPAGKHTAAQPASKPKLFFEKAYLHTDRDMYTQGDTIWYKAYLVNAQNNQPIGISGNLYVELIQPDSAKVITRQIIRMENGTGNADIQLSDSILSGKYTLRAYTNWMRNFGDNFVFEKQLTILNTTAAKPDTAYKPESPVSKISTQLNSKFRAVVKMPLVRFYPESGSLVEGVGSIVAVKAEDSFGKGITASGSLISSSGDTVAHFNCDTLGMGLFAMIPASGQKYHAQITSKNKKDLNVDIPKALLKGFSLRISHTDSVINIIVNCNDAQLADAKGKTYTLSGKHGGKICFSRPLQIADNQMLIKVSSELFPDGIAVITLIDDQNKPQCERLVYIRRPSNNLSIKTDKIAYQSKEKVTVNINTCEKANLSMAVVDAGVVPVQEQDMVSYLQLQSELRGNIEHPERYFDTTNTHREKQLDMLLMTQGWRDFVWRRMADTAIRISYKAEDGFAVTGRVRQKFGNKPIKDANITLTAFKAKGQKIYSARTDTGGHYAINNLQLYGPQDIKINSRNEKGTRLGWLLLDSVNKEPLPVNAKPAVEIDTTSAIIKAVTKQGFDRSKSNMKNGINLKEVKIKDRNAVYLESGVAGTKFGYPDQVFNITKKDADLETLIHWLEYNIPGIHESADGTNVILGGPGGGAHMSAMIVNGREVGPQPHLIMPPMDAAIMNAARSPYYNLGIDKVKTVVYSHLIGLDPDEGKTIDLFVLFLTIVPNALDNKDFGTEIATVDGYYQTRTFYKPQYDTKKDITKPDLRSTIHWEPNIITDEKGQASISFYNADPKTKVRVLVEGLKTAGGAVSGTAVYTVK